MTKLVGIELREAEYIVTSYTQTRDGFWYLNRYLSRLPKHSSDVELGQAVLGALAESNREGPRDPDEGFDPMSDLLAELGLNNYGQYMRGAKSVGVERQPDGNLLVTPMRNGGTREGFVEIGEKAQTISTPSDYEVVGATVRTAFTQTEP